MKNSLLIIDPQNDFADKKGSLSVLNADLDMWRVARFIHDNASSIHNIHVTLDSHHLVHIAHPIYWSNEHGENPKPFTVITSKDVEAKTWIPRDGRALDYLRQLEVSGKYPHVIWPPHCLMGSWGHGIFPCLFESILAWEAEFKIADMIAKGSHAHTEMFSVIRAEVPLDSAPETQTNVKLLNDLASADRIYVGGIAGSHCVANSVRHVAELGGDTIKKMVLLRDTISPVPGFEKLQEDFIKEMLERGMQISDTETSIK